MKLCSECGYCNGDYMNSCARCSAPLSPQPLSQTQKPSAAGQGAPFSASPPPQLTRPQPRAYPQTSPPGMNPMGTQYPPQQPGIYPQTPGVQHPPGLRPQPVMYGPQPQPYPQYTSPRPGAVPMNGPPPYGSPYPPYRREANPQNSMRDEYLDLVSGGDESGETPFPLKSTKRSGVGTVILILLLLLALSGGTVYYFYANELFPAEVNDQIGGVIDSVTGFLGISTEDASGDSVAYDTMVSRVRNDMTMEDEQANAVVSILLTKCGVTDILGISPTADADTYTLNTPEGRCLVSIDPQTKALLKITTIEYTPRVIYENGGALSTVAAMCVNDEEIALLKTHAEKRMKSYLPAESVDNFIFASDEHWNFHKEKGWVAIASYTSPNTENGYNERIPFYFEYEYTNTDNNPSYTFKYAKINEKTLGDPHFPDFINPYEDATTGGSSVAEFPSSAEGGTDTQNGTSSAAGSSSAAQ